MLFPSIINTIIILSLLAIVAVICVFTKKLTPWAGVMAVLVGYVIFGGAGFVGELQLFTFFILSVLATRHKRALKGKAHGEMRDAWQVLANGGVAAGLGLLAMTDVPHKSLYEIMIASSLAAAIADTLSSELGVVYGKRTFNILTLKKDVRGLDGVISIEGTLIGAAGACIIAAIYRWDMSLWIIALSGILGNVADSVLGATLERKGIIGNNMVNFLNTLTGALISLMIVNSIS
jgi:uncharacterized protein (TIGR00297 family)